LAYEHLRVSLTKGNLWLYVLTALEERPATPTKLKTLVAEKHGFAPATITFYSVLYKLRREGLVKKATDSFRSEYEITARGRAELGKGRELLESIGAQITAD
jgi:PadR family transcriptional regulator PadR